MGYVIIVDENGDEINAGNVLPVGIFDSSGNQWELEQNGGMPVNLQDQTSEIIDLYMCKVDGQTTPSAPASLDARSITVVNATGAVVGRCVEISENGKTFQAVIQNIAGLVITFNAPTDQAFTTSAIVKFGQWNMNLDGSATPIIFHVGPPAGAMWDITRIILAINDDSEMDATTFGGIPALTNGIVLRMKNHITKNIFIASDNGGLGERAYDISYDDRRSPLSEFGFRCRRTFAGQEKNGVVIRLDGDLGDQLQLIIQDNLTGLTKMAIVCQGHVVTD